MKHDATQNNDSDCIRKKKMEQRKKAVPYIVILLLLCLCFRSCRVWEQPEQDRIYEEDCTIVDNRSSRDVLPEDAGKRLNLAITEKYHISEEEPVFYIGYPKENVYDVIFTLSDEGGQELHRTGYMAPGTNVGIDGTDFLKKGEQKLDCLVSVYSQESGALISSCTTVVLNIHYE